MNVLHIYKTSLNRSQGGVEVFLDTLCRGTAAKGITNRVLSLSPTPSLSPLPQEGYTLYEAKEDFFLASTGFSFSAFSLFRDLVDLSDIIHYHFPNPFGDLLHFSAYRATRQKPCLVTYHSDIVKQKRLSQLYAPLRSLFLGSMARIVATSPPYLESSQVLSSFQHKTTVIPIGIDSPVPSTSEERYTFWKKTLPKPFFLFIGALRYYKGLQFAIEAVRGTDLNLVIGGTGELDSFLKEDASNNQRIHFLGLLSPQDKSALLTLCEGFIFPSHLRSEAFGIALLEAASYGKPLISCAIGTGTSYVNLHHQTGLVVPPESPDALREAMYRILQNPQEAQQWGSYAQERAKTLFSSQAQAQSYWELYHTLSS